MSLYECPYDCDCNACFLKRVEQRKEAKEKELFYNTQQLVRGLDILQTKAYGYANKKKRKLMRAAAYTRDLRKWI